MSLLRGCRRCSHGFFEFGDLTSISICLLTKNQLWSIDPDDGEARLLGRPVTMINAERALFDCEEEDIPITTWLPTGESIVDDVACNTFRQHINGVDAHCVRYVSASTGFLVQEQKLLPN